MVPLPLERYEGESFGKYVRRVRRSLDVTQDELGAILGSTQQTIVSRIERGAALPTEAMVKPLAKFLGMRVDDVRLAIQQERLLAEHAVLMERVAEVEERMRRAGLTK